MMVPYSFFSRSAILDSNSFCHFGARSGVFSLLVALWKRCSEGKLDELLNPFAG